MDKRKRPCEGDAFNEAMQQLEKDPHLVLLKRYAQHQGNTTYEHSKSVALASYRLARILHLCIDGESLARGAMLHDYYLYSTDRMDKTSYEHGVTHPKIALKNAEKHFELNDRERNIIESHMWPLTMMHFPREREAVLVSLADKYCALAEMSMGSYRIARQYVKDRIDSL